MKRAVYFTVLGLLFVSPSLFAQQIKSNAGVYDQGMRPDFKDKITAEERAKIVTMKMKKELKLSDDTARIVYRINLASETEYDEQLKNSPDMTEYDKAMLKKIKSNQQEELKKILSPEQWEQLSKNAEQQKKQGIGNPSGGESRPRSGNRSW